MQFRTQIPIAKSDHPIDYNSKMVSLGSCFAVNMGEKFDHFKFQNTVNPFGILFHPIAIENFLKHSVSGRAFTDDDIFFHNERWHCFDTHSELSDIDKDKVLRNLNSRSSSAKNSLINATHAIITYGTSWVYRNLETRNIVANCHKLPQKNFGKELLLPDMIAASIENTVTILNKLNPKLQIIITVSPVRHIKDGLVENQWSKANLISAVHQTVAGNASVNYFPSYEIMMDELRDYRFYAEDMIHPSEVAVDYIWEQFAKAYISNDCKGIMDEISAIRSGLQHRPFSPASEQHRTFIDALSKKIASLSHRFPHIKF